MSLDEDLKAMRGKLEWQRGQHSMLMDNRRFNLDAYKSVNEIGMRWVDVQMKVEKHIVDMANEWLDYNNKVMARTMYQAEMKRLFLKRRKLEKQTALDNRHIMRAEQVFEGSAIKTSDRVESWTRFGELARLTRIVFPPTSGTATFWEAKSKNNWVPIELVTPRMTMFQASRFCVRRRLMVDPFSTAFEAIMSVFDEIWSRQQLKAERLIKEIDTNQERIDAANQQQWKQAGLI